MYKAEDFELHFPLICPWSEGFIFLVQPAQATAPSTINKDPDTV